MLYSVIIRYFINHSPNYNFHQNQNLLWFLSNNCIQKTVKFLAYIVYIIIVGYDDHVIVERFYCAHITVTICRDEYAIALSEARCAPD